MVDDVVVGDNVTVLCQSFIDESFWIILIDILPICSRNISQMFEGNNGLKETTSYEGFGMRNHVQVVGPIQKYQKICHLHLCIFI